MAYTYERFVENRREASGCTSSVQQNTFQLTELNSTEIRANVYICSYREEVLSGCVW